MQGLDNDKPIPRGEPMKYLISILKDVIRTSEHRPSGEIIKEKSDLCRLQDEDLRSRVAENESGENHITDDYVNIEHQSSVIRNMIQLYIQIQKMVVYIYQFDMMMNEVN